MLCEKTACVKDLGLVTVFPQTQSLDVVRFTSDLPRVVSTIKSDSVLVIVSSYTYSDCEQNRSFTAHNDQTIEKHNGKCGTRIS